jgi:ABC-type transporter Mla subunit MlaD
MSIHRVHWSQLRIGVAVSVVATAVSLLIFFVDDVRDAVEDRYTLYVRTFTTQALRPRAPVWLAGQPIGQVRSLGFEPPREDTPERLIVEMSLTLDAQPFITEGAVAQVTTSSLMGEVVVNIVPGDEPALPLGDGDELPPAAELDPSKVIRRLRALYDSLPPVGARWRRVREAARHGDGSLARLARQPAELSELLANLNRASAVFDTLGSAAGSLAGLLSDPQVRAELDRIGPRLGRLVELWETGGGTAGRFASDTLIQGRLNGIVEGVARLQDRLSAGRGTAGRLLYDRALADELARTRALLEELRAEFAPGRREQR